MALQSDNAEIAIHVHGKKGHVFSKIEILNHWASVCVNLTFRIRLFELLEIN